MDGPEPEAKPGFWTRVTRFFAGSSRARGLTAIAIACIVSVITWAALDRPVDAPDWNAPIRGVSYNPSHTYNAADHETYSEDRIRADLTQLKRVTNRVRT